MKSRICVLVLMVLPLTSCLSASSNAASEDDLFGELVPVDGEDQPEADVSADEEAQEVQTGESESARLRADNEELKDQLAGLQSKGTSTAGESQEAEEPEEATEDDVAAKPVYVCSMHPEVRSDDAESGCPECGMTLVLLEAEEPVEDTQPVSEQTAVVEYSIPAMGQTVNDDVNNCDKLWLEVFYIKAGDEIDVGGFERETESGERAYSTTKVDLVLLRLKKGLTVKMLGCIFIDKEGNREESYLPVIATERSGRRWYLINLDPIKDLMDDPEVAVAHYIIADADNDRDAWKYLDRGRIVKIRANTFQPAEIVNDAGEVTSRVWTTRFETRSDMVAVVKPEESPDRTVYYNFAFSDNRSSEVVEVEPVDPEVEPVDPEEEFGE